jgi:5-hydroxyisourate hydrolase-like protein (transthyretin family)
LNPEPKIKPVKAAAAGRFNQTHIVHNVFEDGRKGMIVHADFQVQNLQGIETKVNLYVYDAQGDPLKDNVDDDYQTPNKHIAMSKVISPSSDFAKFEDLTIFFPYEEFHIVKGKQSLKIKLTLTTQNENQRVDKISDSDFLTFDYDSGVPDTTLETAPSKVSSRINQIHVDHNVFEEGRKGMRIHVKVNFFNLKGTQTLCQAFFYYSNGTRLKDFNGLYVDPDGFVSHFIKLTPSFENTIYEDATLFVPYSELHLGTGKYDVKFFVHTFYQSNGWKFIEKSAPVYFTYED